MSYDVLEAKLKTIPEQYLPEVSEFLDFVQCKVQQNSSIKTRTAGILKGKIWMADDFDETPIDFKDYV